MTARIISLITKGTIDNPIEGDVRRGSELGYKCINQSYIAVPCIDCGKLRWIPSNHVMRLHRRLRCNQCTAKSRPLSQYLRGESHPQWNGGRTQQNYGYILFKLQKDSFFYSMANILGYVLEHRLIMAKHLGRCLQDWEDVHHKNGVKDDNRLRNLKLFTHSEHTMFHAKEREEYELFGQYINA